MGAVPQEENLLLDASNRPQASTRIRRVGLICGCIALVAVGYAFGSRRSSPLMDDGAVVSESGAILTENDFKTLYSEVTGKVGLTESQVATINSQITGGTPTPTDENVKMLMNWYTAASNSNKIFANKLIVESMSSTTKTAATPAASTDADTASAKCPISTYAEFGHLYSKETAGKSWPAINKIDSWARRAIPAVGAPLSVRKLRDCYKRTLSTAEQKDFTDNAVAHMKAGAER